MTSARILLIEDEPALLSILKASIAYGGFTEQSVGTGAEALDLFRRSRFDAVLIDLGLPDLDGAEVLRQLREMSDLPIIVVSGRDSERDKIEALDLGADDYVPKPFLPGELLARIRAALRRHRSAGRSPQGQDRSTELDPLRLAGMLLHPLDRAVELDGRRASLSGAEFRVLKALAERAGGVVGKPELLQTLYGGEPPSDTRVIEVYISNIRRKLRALSDEELIFNIRGQGWTLATPA